MCNQTVGLVQAEIERQGIRTASISLLREITEKITPPRALCVPFNHGYPLGKPNDFELQTNVLLQLLDLASDSSPVPILHDYVGE